MPVSNLESQVSGTVWKVEQASGSAVSEGDVVLIVESMKMEIPVEAPASGTLKLLVGEGDAINEGQVIGTVT